MPLAETPCMLEPLERPGMPPELGKLDKSREEQAGQREAGKVISYMSIMLNDTCENCKGFERKVGNNP